MSVNSGMFSSATDMWATPQDLFDELNAEHHFTLDVCAVAENAKCPRYYSPADDGLMQDWVGVCWMNPPYGRDMIKWLEKAKYEADLFGVTTACLIPARTKSSPFNSIGGLLRFGPD